MSEQQAERIRMLRQFAADRDWTENDQKIAEEGLSVVRRWEVRGAPVVAELTYAVNARDAPTPEFVVIRLEFTGLDLWFAVDLHRAGDELRSVLESFAVLPDELSPATVRGWLAELRARVPVRWIAGEIDEPWQDLTAVWDGSSDPAASPDGVALSDLLSDDPFAHPVALPFREDGARLMDEPRWARARRVLARAGWHRASSADLVFGAGLDYFFDNGRAVLHAGWVNDELRMYVSVPATGDAAASKWDVRVALPEDAGDRVLRLVLDWQDRVSGYCVLWFLAELGAIAPGSTAGANLGGQAPIQVSPPPPPVGSAPEGVEARSAAFVAALEAVGWTEVDARSGPLLASLRAMRAPDGPGHRWRCEYVVTGYPELPEALRLSGVDIAEGDPFVTAPGMAVDALVDLTGVGEPEALVGEDAPRRRLAGVIECILRGGPAGRVVAAVNLVAAYYLPAPGVALEMPIDLGLPDDLPRRPARPLAEAGQDDDRWLEAGFAACAARRWHLAAASFAEAARRGIGAGLAELWLGALRYADPVEAFAVLDEAVAKGFGPAARRLQANICERAGDRQSMLAVLARAVAEEPDDAGLTAWYGLELARVGRTDEAIALLDAALGHERTSTRLWYRGYAHLRAGDRAGALDDLVAAAGDDAALAGEIYRDPDLAALRGEPRFEALTLVGTRAREGVARGLRRLLDVPCWREGEDGKLLRWDDDFEGAIFTVFAVDEDGMVVLGIDDGVSNIMLFRVDLAGAPEALVDTLSRWPDEFTDEDLEGSVDVDALVDALSTAYPGKVSFMSLGTGWIPVGASTAG